MRVAFWTSKRPYTKTQITQKWFCVICVFVYGPLLVAHRFAHGGDDGVRDSLLEQLFQFTW